MNVNLVIGKKIKDIRESRGLTREDVSSLTKEQISPSRLSNYELGHRKIGLDEVIVIARALGISPATVMPPDFTQATAPPVNRTLLAKTILEAEQARISDPEAKAKLIALLYSYQLQEEPYDFDNVVSIFKAATL